MRIVFMGTPESAVPSLRRLLDDGHEIVAVWTQPDRPAGRGNKLHQSAVKDFASQRNLTIHQPFKIKTEEAKALFSSHNADAAIVVAYGRILPAEFLNAPHHGCINVHFSLLPKYRGAAPVNWAIVNGEKETGVTTMKIVEELDAGPILLQRATEIQEDETAPELLTRLADVGAELLSETLKRFDTIRSQPQRDEEATLAPILKEQLAFPLGQIIEAHGDRLTIACGDRTALRVSELQTEGGRRLSARDFLNGTHLKVGEVLGPISS